MLSSTNKKVKTTNNNSSSSASAGNDEFDQVKQYLLNCPLVPSNHPAIQVAVAAIDKEQQRMERDRKLQQKFSQGKQPISSTAVGGESTMSSSVLDDSVVVVERRSSRSSSPTTTTPAFPPPAIESDDNDMADEMEWQDVQAKEKEAWDDDDNDDDDDPTSTTTGSFLGKQLAKLTIDAIAEHHTKLQSPLASIAVAFHASLRSDVLGFNCTGVPEDPSAASKGGFAPPIRELPKTQFLPNAWDGNPTRIALRYRKDGTGAMILTVELGDDQMVTVRWQPSNSKEDSQTLTFLLGDHLNLDSWNAALKTAPSVSPALHYKSLALLLSNFCRTFDLGTIHEEGMDQADPVSIPTPSVKDTTTARPFIQKSDFVPASTLVPPVGMNRKPDFKNDFPTTLDEAFPGLNGPLRPQGDFAGDLLPPGLLDPRMSGGGRMGGNLMGPNHPMFQGGGDGDHFGIPMGGPGSMQPRFDPIYPNVVDFPPGVGAPPGRRSNRPSRSGEPNPDHLPPPNSFGNNMFM